MENSIFRFKELEDDKEYEICVLLTSVVQKMARNNNPFLELQISDGEQEIKARLFNSTKEELEKEGVAVGDIVEVIVIPGIYNGVRNYKITHIGGCLNPNISEENFIIKAPIDIDRSFEEFIELIKDSHVSNWDDLFFDSIAGLTCEIVFQNRDAFKQASAAKTIHHNVVGGLLYHSLTMVKQAYKVLEEYPTLDKELLICGTALHDIGKIYEMDTTKIGHTEYTQNGRLLGHTAIGIMMIEEASKNGEYDSLRVKMLEHMIAAHHGQQEYGAIVAPAIPEAVVLHALDMVDSKVYVFNKEYEGMKEHTLSENIYALGGKTIYKPTELDISDQDKLSKMMIKLGRI